MKTITAKELRDNLDQIVKRTELGESIEVTYRSKAAFTIVPCRVDPAPEPGSPAAMRQFFKKIDALHEQGAFKDADPTKSTKELYHEILDSDPKYTGNHV